MSREFIHSPTLLFYKKQNLKGDFNYGKQQEYEQRSKVNF